MILENEVVSVILSVGVLVLLLLNWPRLAGLPRRGLLFAGFTAFTLGRGLTVLESLLPREPCNLLEHLCCASSSALLATWSWLVLGRGRGGS